MKTNKTMAFRLAAIAIGLILLTSAYTRIHSASVMADAAKAFLASLDAPTTCAGHLPVSGRRALRLALHPQGAQGASAARHDARRKSSSRTRSSRAGLSQHGYIKAVSIMSLDEVLRHARKRQGPASAIRRATSSPFSESHRRAAPGAIASKGITSARTSPS